MKSFLNLILFILIWPGLTLGQSSYTNILISSQNGPNEVSICLNPKNINQITGGANINNTYYSSDGGSTWGVGQINSSLYGVWGDPIVTVDTAGAFYYFHLANPSPPGHFVDRIVCQKSTDAGVTYIDPGTYTGLNGTHVQDKHGVCVDWTHGSRGNWIYVTWTDFDNYFSPSPSDSSKIMFSRSSDGGNSWTTALRISHLAGDCHDGDNTMEGAVPCVGPNGELYDAWSGPHGFGNPVIYFDKSTDGGNTWLPDNIIAGTQPGGWDYLVSGIYRNNGLPCTLCDISNGPYRGNIYINYTDSAGPADHDVKIIRSTNGGANWSNPIRVNDDPPGKEQFFSWMAIDQITGYLYVVFYDRRNYSDLNTDVYMAHSTNGGTTWINERISSSPFSPGSAVFFGDYNGISAVNGRIRPMWTRLESGALSVWTALIDIPVGVEPVNSEIPSKFALHQNYPNPFNPTTKIRFDIPKQTERIVTLKVYDLLGKETAILVDGNLRAGSYEINWDASGFSSGVYFCTLSAGSFKETRKLVLTK